MLTQPEAKIYSRSDTIRSINPNAYFLIRKTKPRPLAAKEFRGFRSLFNYFAYEKKWDSMFVARRFEIVIFRKKSYLNNKYIR